jgi:predicted acetyltransferase
MRFTSLEPAHERALVEFVADFRAAGETSIPAFFQQPQWNHAETIAHFDAWAGGDPMGQSGDRLEGFVQCTTRFLEDEASGELLGLFNFRHELNSALERFGGHVGYSVRPSARGKGYAKQLLREAMAFGTALGLTELVVTCAPSNVASARVIEACGGQLQDTYFNEERTTDVCRYRIALDG